MVNFLGILSPGTLRRWPAAEAPRKASFFGGMPDPAWGAVPMSRAEQDTQYLAGKAPEPDRPRQDPRFEGMPER